MFTVIKKRNKFGHDWSANHERFASDKIGINNTTESSQEEKILTYLTISPCGDTKWDSRAQILFAG